MSSGSAVSSGVDSVMRNRLGQVRRCMRRHGRRGADIAPADIVPVDIASVDIACSGRHCLFQRGSNFGLLFAFFSLSSAMKFAMKNLRSTERRFDAKIKIGN